MSFTYCPNVYVDGEGHAYPGGAASYESELRTLLDRIAATQTGRAILGLCDIRNHPIWIIPFSQGIATPRNRSPGPREVNAFAFPNGRGRDSYALGAQQRDGNGHVVSHANTPRGTGRGVAVDIVFSPILFSNRPNIGADRALLHELFHAIRFICGAATFLPGPPPFDNCEEFYAILVENMYASETGRATRVSHGRSANFETPDHSMRNNPAFREPMRRLDAAMPGVVSRLAVVRTTYNPFHDWRDWAASHPNAQRRHGQTSNAATGA